MPSKTELMKHGLEMTKMKLRGWKPYSKDSGFYEPMMD